MIMLDKIDAMAENSPESCIVMDDLMVSEVREGMGRLNDEHDSTAEARVIKDRCDGEEKEDRGQMKCSQSLVEYRERICYLEKAANKFKLEAEAVAEKYAQTVRKNHLLAVNISSAKKENTDLRDKLAGALGQIAACSKKADMLLKENEKLRNALSSREEAVQVGEYFEYDEVTHDTIKKETADEFVKSEFPALDLDLEGASTGGEESDTVCVDIDDESEVTAGGRRCQVNLQRLPVQIIQDKAGRNLEGSSVIIKKDQPYFDKFLKDHKRKRSIKSQESSSSSSMDVRNITDVNPNVPPPGQLPSECLVKNTWGQYGQEH